ncbi:MAG: hypothetical protein RL199_784 [Pseudomonadota bacterium]|jgi:uncharacterized protein (TIGR04552 family)
MTLARPSLFERFSPENLSVGDLEVLRLILHGESVVDWQRLQFRTRAEVDHFLRLNLFDPDDPEDQRRLRAILRQAVDYLRRSFRYKVAPAVAEPREVQDLFLLASGIAEPVRLRRIACVVLKVMHTVHHIEARELLHRARISEVEISQLVDQRVHETVDRLVQHERLPILSLEGSAKTRTSVITKLIAKKENVAAQIYDRHRYRVVVSDRDALVGTVLALADMLFPFNYVVPGQTQNSLVSMGELLEKHPSLASMASHLLDENAGAHAANEFSGHDYRILNFIVDLPIRIDATALAMPRDDEDDLGRIVFAPVELQVVDAPTAEANERGENAHDLYKKRQLRRVLGRLSRGLVVPKKPPHKPEP